tara:strand:- start:5312 stop:5794 length:483 start_codon:yes stop_codon:yes gene_type:complete
MNTNIENNSFLLLSAHRNKYFEEFSKKLDKDNKNYQGFILEELFFSESNIEIIQKQLVLSIFNKTNRKYLIPFQNYKSILTVMKFIFNDQAKHLPYDITDQIKELNLKVIQELTPMIIKNIDSKMKYLEDINSPPPINDLPINVNSAGNKTLPSISYTFN